MAMVAIIGYGTAGVNALIGLRNAGYDGEVSVFSDIETLPYSPILTSYYAGGEKTFEECFPWSAEELDELDAKVVHEPVIGLDPRAHAIRTQAGEYAYDKCVIATGATPSRAGFPEMEGEAYEPLVLRTMADAERLRAVLEDTACERVLVSGASMVALKTLEACLNRGKKATLVGMMPHVLDMNALPQAAERFERGLRGKGVELRLGQTIAAVRRTADSALEVTFSNGEADVFNAICVAHGMRCNLGFVEPGSLEVDEGLLVDEHMRTSDADVYAAGDVAQATELISGAKHIVGIWKNAALQGACAGAAIAAELAGVEPSADCALRGSISTNTISVNGTLFISAGTIEVGPNWPDRRVEVREEADMTVVYVLEGERLVGFNLVCDHDEEGGLAYDTGAMLTLRIEAGLR